MRKQIIIGFTTEGKTDVRFLEHVIQRTFEDVALECTGDVEVLPVQHVTTWEKGDNFIDMVKNHAYKADDLGVMVLCVHTDADDRNDSQAFNNKINPSFIALSNEHGEKCCKNLVAVVPVRMTEAWMLGDKELLKTEIGTSISDIVLAIDRPPENYADPKDAIESAVRISRQHLTRRRRNDLTIAQLYLPIGQKISLLALGNIQSYQKFKVSVREAFKKLNYL